MKLEPKRDVRRLVMIILAAAISAFNINSFVGSAGLFPGGFSGLSLLIQDIFDKFLGIMPGYALINLLLNAVPAVIAFRFIGKKFTLFSGVFLLLSSLLVDIFPKVNLPYDSMLLSMFGGILSGFSISLCLNAGATSGGTDFLSIFASERYGIDTFNYVLAGNVVILSVAGLLFGWERSLYSIIYQFVSTQVIHAMFMRYQKQTLFIVTDKPDAVYKVISENTHHDATLFRGEGLYQQAERSMLYSVVSRAEARPLVRAVLNVDPHAFINSIRTQSLSGRFYQRPND